MPTWLVVVLGGIWVLSATVLLTIPTVWIVEDLIAEKQRLEDDN